jgi:hypothetical protein
VRDTQKATGFVLMENFLILQSSANMERAIWECSELYLIRRDQAENEAMHQCCAERIKNGRKGWTRSFGEQNQCQYITVCVIYLADEPKKLMNYYVHGFLCNTHTREGNLVQ